MSAVPAAEPRIEGRAIPAAPPQETVPEKTGIWWKQGLPWHVIKALGSLQLALFLLAVIGVACAVATFYEAGFSRAIAKHYIYNAPWFIFWLALLCVNLFAVTLTRWPWRKKHIGFVLTHYSIIVLLIGAMIGMHFGFEGNVTLRKEQPPTDRITTSRSIVQLEDPNSFALYIKPFDASVLRMSPERPRVLPVPGTNWRIEAQQFAADLVREPALAVAPPEAAAGPGVLIELHSASIGSTQRHALAASASESKVPARADFFGMAQILWLAQAPKFEKRTVAETQVAFARFEPVREGEATGVRIQPSQDGRTVRIAVPGAAAVVYSLAEVLGRPLRVGSATVLVSEYWPDFEMADGKPRSKSSQPNNPAVLARVTMDVDVAAAGGAAPWPAQGLALALAPAGDAGEAERHGETGKTGAVPAFRYWITRDGRVESSGTVPLNEAIATGWNDWTFTVQEHLPRAVATERVRPARAGVAAEKSGIPGFLAVLDADGQRGEPTWVESGRVTTLAAGHKFVRLGYGLKLERVPFTIRLVNFEVPRFEGTDSPSNFIATVEFRDKATGQTQRGVARMNSPASWPGGFWPLVTGLNYKFSQAEWNPRDLNETTLQVLYDPGWMLKWIGSLGICAGIGIMFFWKPRQPGQSAGGRRIA